MRRAALGAGLMLLASLGLAQERTLYGVHEHVGLPGLGLR